jgi:hypothetical protein
VIQEPEFAKKFAALGLRHGRRHRRGLRKFLKDDIELYRS